MSRSRPVPAPDREVDLHGLRPHQALQRLVMELHSARLAGSERLLVITGRGLGNHLQRPILRARVETWLRAEGARFGVQGWVPTSRGGALLVRLRMPSADHRAPGGPRGA
jgi:DNA-nicking Smr family endonuclease